MITKMVLENFKSYGGVKEIGPFHKCFSSVVGPNGSGKSNVIDAMLFVFGKKASQMRLSKVSELIHKSAEYPDLRSCRVSVYFQDIIDDGSEDGFTPVDGTQLVVTRTADKSNQSKYYINGSTSTFTEVTELLRRRGIDLDNNRFLILQGEVEQIAMMKPKAVSAGEDGLLEYLEDIIGSAQYVPKIAEAERIVEELSTQRTEKLTRTRAAEKERDALASAKAEAEAVMAKERGMTRQRGLIAQKVAAEAEAEVTAAGSKQEDLTTKHAATKEKLTAFIAGLTERIAAVELHGKEHDAAAEALTKLTAAMASLERRDIKIREDAAAAKLTYKKHEATIERETKALQENEGILETSSQTLPPLEASMTRLGADKAKEEEAYEAVLMGMRGETETLRSSMEAKQAELTPLAQVAAEATAAVDTARTELKLLKERMESAGKDTDVLRTQMVKTESDIAARTSELAAAKTELTTATARQAELGPEEKAIESKEVAAAEAAKIARVKFEEARAAMTADGGAKGGLAAQLMGATKRGGPLASAGLHGRLGDLGAIDSKYDVAISTACSALDWLVVETTEGGQACIDYLRAKGLGRAKFITLDKISWVAERMDAAFKAPEGTPRLFDLIRVKDPRFRAAFYFALRDTLVAADIDQATRIAYASKKEGPARVVTVGGDLIESSGTMTGGGKAVRKGGMSASLSSGVTAEEVAAAEKEAAEVSLALTQLRARRVAIQTEMKELVKNIPKLHTRISKLEMDLVSLNKLKDDISSRIAAALARVDVSAEDTAQMASLQRNLASLENRKATAVAAAGRIESEVAALQRQVLEAGGERVRRAKARLDRANETLEEAHKAATKAKSDAKAAEKAIDKANKAIERANAEKLEVKAQAEKLRAQMQEVDTEAVKVATEKAEAEKAAASSKEALTAAKAALDAAERDGKALKSADAELSAALEEATAVLAATKKKVTAWKSKLQAYSAEYDSAMKAYIAELQHDAELGIAAAAIGAATAASSTSAAPASDAASRADGGDGVAASTADAAPGVRVDEPLTLPMLSPEQLAKTSMDSLQHKLTALEAERDALAKKVNMKALSEYREKEREYLKRVAELDAVSQARETAKKQWEMMRKKRLDEFMAGFGVISLRLKEMYQMITLGGDAELELADSCDPFAEGIVFQVRPPKKSWKHISNLSGGEKTLSSLALVFALHHYKPTPLYVMDEIDAALDFKNVSIVANYIKERTKNAQFVIISLRNNMFELADRLVGIYKTHDVTKSITINPKAVAAECGIVCEASRTHAKDAPAAAAAATAAMTGI